MSSLSTQLAEAIATYSAGVDRSILFDLIMAFRDIRVANEELNRMTGVRRFFPDREALDNLRQILTQQDTCLDRSNLAQWGDFQTPPSLAAQVCQYLAGLGTAPRLILEPTYGAGHFILAALRSFPLTDLVYGVEIQGKYEWSLKLALLLEAARTGCHHRRAEIELHQDDIFSHRFSKEILAAQNILVLGNPPWVTNAALGTMNAGNLPVKRNLKGLNGIDAITGSSNFDIAEFVLLRLLELFSGRFGTLAMLCKNSVIRNIVEILPRRGFRVTNLQALEIDAGKHFGAAVSASLLVLTTGAPKPTYTCRVAALDNPTYEARAFGWVRGKFVSSIDDYESSSQIDGRSPHIWRQGLKHDCAKIMELDALGDTRINGNGQTVDVETAWLYPLVKSSDVRVFEVTSARKRVVLTQRYLGQDTSQLRRQAPKLWDYLSRNRDYFSKRKSSIYRGKPDFSIFGIGEYSFKPYKVAISGLYKEPLFSLLSPIDDRPVMLDDTCYFLGFDTYLDALLTASLLNGPIVKRFLQSIVFIDAKRPYTKQILMRIDLRYAASQASLDTLRSFWTEIGYRPRAEVTEGCFRGYQQRLRARAESVTASQLPLFNQ